MAPLPKSHLVSGCSLTLSAMAPRDKVSLVTGQTDTEVKEQFASQWMAFAE